MSVSFQRESEIGSCPANQSCTAPTTRERGWEYTSCLLCGRDDAVTELEARDISDTVPGLTFRLQRCRHCGLHYTNPRPDPSSIGEFYHQDYKPHRRPRQMRRPLRRWYRGVTGLDWSRAGERRSLPMHGRGRLLDFGCGGGSFLLRMAEQGWDVTGLDASVGAVQQIRDEFGLTALAGSLPHPELSRGSYDMVTMWHSLEHVHEPLEILREAHDLLVPGGRLLIAVPNIASWPYHWFGSSWFGLDLPRHLTHFTPTTLQAMIERAGFQVREVRPIRHADWLRSSARLAINQGTASTWHHLLRFKPVARLIAWGCYLAARSDCILAWAER